MEALQLLISFGPIAFGTIVFLVIWRLVVKPELEIKKADTLATQQMIQALTNLQNGSTAHAEILKGLVDSQTVMVRELGKLMERADHSRLDS